MVPERVKLFHPDLVGLMRGCILSPSVVLVSGLHPLWRSSPDKIRRSSVVGTLSLSMSIGVGGSVTGDVSSVVSLSWLVVVSSLVSVWYLLPSFFKTSLIFHGFF